jgi:hypothetical protein
MISEEPVKVLGELANRFAKRLARCQVFDPNVCTYEAAPRRPWKLVPIEGEPFSHRLHYVYRQRKMVFLANSVYVNGSVSGTFEIGVLAINRKEKTGFRAQHATTLVVGGKAYPVFADTQLSKEQRALLKRPELFGLIKESGLQDFESLNLSNGELSFYFRRPTLERLTRAIDRIIDLAREIEVPKRELNFKLMPVEFHHLISLVRKWGVGDDLEREDLLANSPRPALQALVDKVEPRLDAINSYLDSFGDRAPSEEAAALARLAECVVEARLLLNRRKHHRIKP